MLYKLILQKKKKKKEIQQKTMKTTSYKPIKQRRMRLKKKRN